ncbi:NAD(P)H-dependent oxidoreductase [Tsukamurella sp. 8F]|uniref:NADPH-dependent FMN reductase n=1 Tax=unclassified Tsukamurella TaxID=2633480 RepID=UPI0023B91865|nr:MULTISPECIES: NAD(P)H-dependent oxidoreductase [unclassified Tsukamurella]MDF0529001.1 NAD(P)H-dependent oxidoreductase [Tsukamurella sp. 8J]MDF0587374.1 NAD(P)H-dependent oxidoreductase [Tsukamurella sp. 8F]
MKIGIIIGSVRDGRNGEAVAQWVYKAAEERTDAEFEIIDLKSFGVPVLTSATVPGAANKQYDDPAVTAWSKAIDEHDGFVFVTPEYNHGVPGGFKNAFDSLGSEWAHKTVGFVSYGADGGIRAVEQWRQIVANFHMVDVRSQVALGLFTDFGPDGLNPLDRRAGELTGLLDALVTATEKLRG